MLVFDSGGNDLSNFLRLNDVDLDVLHDEIKLNSEVAIFDNQLQKDVNHRPKTTEDSVFHLLVTNHHWV